MATAHPATTNRSPSCRPCSRLITTTTGPSLTYLPVRRSRAKPETTPPTSSAHNQRIIGPTLGRDAAPDTPSARRRTPPSAPPGDCPPPWRAGGGRWSAEARRYCTRPRRAVVWRRPLTARPRDGQAAADGEVVDR